MSNYVFRAKHNKISDQDDLKIILHADDFGLCDDITNEIFDCIKAKRITRTSIVCNTVGFPYAKELYRKYSNMFDVGLHLNLVEGGPVSNLKEVNLLVNNCGEFRYTFISLWLSYLFSKKSHKILLKEQVKKEIKSQIDLFKTLWSDDKVPTIHIDGHTHIHMIPFILNAIIEISEENKIGSIRITNERFFFCKDNLHNYLSLNIIKHFLLNLLSHLQIDKIRKSGLNNNDYIIGILSTGNMNFNSISTALKKLKNVKNNGVIEILFHPGGYVKDKKFKECHLKFHRYYTSKNRNSEKKLLIGDNLSNLFNNQGLLYKK